MWFKNIILKFMLKKWHTLLGFKKILFIFIAFVYCISYKVVGQNSVDGRSIVSTKDKTAGKT